MPAFFRYVLMFDMSQKLAYCEQARKRKFALSD